MASRPQVIASANPAPQLTSAFYLFEFQVDLDVCREFKVKRFVSACKFETETRNKISKREKQFGKQTIATTAVLSASDVLRVLSTVMAAKRERTYDSSLDHICVNPC